MTAISPVTELATLLVQNDFLRSEVDDQNRRAAREAERLALAREIDAMHDAADAIATKAWVQGAMAAAGGAAQCYGSLGQVGNTPPAEDASDAERCAFRECNLELEALGRAGSGLSGIAAPAGELLGGVPKAHADAAAADARNDAEQAAFRADEAAKHRERVERHTDAVLDLVESTLEAEHQGNFAILANF